MDWGGPTQQVFFRPLNLSSLSSGFFPPKRTLPFPFTFPLKCASGLILRTPSSLIDLPSQTWEPHTIQPSYAANGSSSIMCAILNFDFASISRSWTRISSIPHRALLAFLLPSLLSFDLMMAGSNQINLNESRVLLWFNWFSF